MIYAPCSNRHHGHGTEGHTPEASWKSPARRPCKHLAVTWLLGDSGVPSLELIPRDMCVHCPAGSKPWIMTARNAMFSKTPLQCTGLVLASWQNQHVLFRQRLAQCTLPDVDPTQGEIPAPLAAPAALAQQDNASKHWSPLLLHSVFLKSCKVSVSEVLQTTAQTLLWRGLSDTTVYQLDAIL